MYQLPSLEIRINSFAELGKVLGKVAKSFDNAEPDFSNQYPGLNDALLSAGQQNPWFTSDNIAFALKAWGKALSPESLDLWVKLYADKIPVNPSKRIAVIMAGNIPLVGFHDFLSTLMAGCSFLGKLSASDKVLLPALAEILCKIEPGFKPMIMLTEGKISNFDAVIATGSNNTARYFEYYFAKYPHIIRKNRNGTAVLSGNENNETLELLGGDICRYFGLGCRSVSKVFVPEGYDPRRLFIAVEPYKESLNNHYKYMNNYNYHRSVYLLNQTPHLDNGVTIITESSGYAAPIPVVNYEFYKNLPELRARLDEDKDLIQCIASNALSGDKIVPIGGTQNPELWDYADGVDTMAFLLSNQNT